jgi:hypothetical protein
MVSLWVRNALPMRCNIDSCAWTIAIARSELECTYSANVGFARAVPFREGCWALLDLSQGVQLTKWRLYEQWSPPIISPLGRAATVRRPEIVTSGAILIQIPCGI